MYRAAGALRLLRSRSTRRRDQSGFMLLIVLGLLIFFSLVVGALLLLLTSGQAVASGAALSSRQIRLYDSVMNSAVNKIRRDSVNAGDGTALHPSQTCVGYDFGTLPGGIKSLTCNGPPPLPPGTPPHPWSCTKAPPGTTDPSNTGTGIREMVLHLYQTSGLQVACAHVLISDRSNNASLPGYSLEVCDWQIGASLRDAAEVQPC
jgi:hypothetical protein